MKEHMIPGRLKPSYDAELGRLFYLRVNLFCYITIAAFSIQTKTGGIL